MIVKHAKRQAGTRDRVQGLLAYLAGPGKREEHTNPRVVAGWSEDWQNLPLGDPQAQWDLADELEWPARLFGTETPSGGFVYHVPISLHADDGQFSDAQWGYVARKAIAKLGFEECRWVAVHHGLAPSKEGPRDHVHLVVHRARENGNVASVSDDFTKMAQLRAELEDDPTLGLTVKTQRQGGGRGGWSRGEQERARRAGHEEVDSERLEILVRAAAGSASSEAEWVQTMRQYGVLVSPRYAPGGRSQVVGYSVAMKPSQAESGGRPRFCAGGKLAKDLSLTAVRQRWEGQDPADSLYAWSKRQAPDRPERGSVWPQAQQSLDDYIRMVRSIPLSDHTAWRMVSRETSEVVASLATCAPSGERAELSRAAGRLARSAELPRGYRRGSPSRGGSAVRAACQAITSAALAGNSTHAAVTQLAQQVVALIDTVQQANHTSRDVAAIRKATNAKAEILAMDQRLNSRTTETAPHPARLAALASPSGPPRPRQGTNGPSGSAGGRAHWPQPGTDSERGHGR